MKRTLFFLLYFFSGTCYSLENNFALDWETSAIENKIREVLATTKITSYELLAWYTLKYPVNGKYERLSDHAFFWILLSNYNKWALLQLIRTKREPDWQVFIIFKYTSWKIFLQYYDNPPKNSEFISF